MARTKTRKLLLCEDESYTTFFDLENDPEETTNLIKDARYQADVVSIKDALMRWMLFETKTPVHVDEDAQRCGGDNVVSGDKSAREDMAAYFREKIQPALR